jgi:hypothetical protein
LTPEGKVKEEIKQVLEAAKITAASGTSAGMGWYFMPVPTGYGVRGIPDFIGHYQGAFFAIEAKVPNGKPKPWQDRQLKLIKDGGGFSIVATCGMDVTVMLEAMVDALQQ